MITVEDLSDVDKQAQDVVAAIRRDPVNAMSAAWALAEMLIGSRLCEDAQRKDFRSVRPEHFDHLDNNLYLRLMPLAELTVAYLQGDGTDFADELLTACDRYLQTRGIEQDGPVSPHEFRFKGVVYGEVPSKVAAILAHLWHRRNQTATWDDLAAPVWGDHAKEVNDGMIRGVQTQATNYFDAHAIPIRIARNSKMRTVRVEILPE